MSITVEIVNAAVEPLTHAIGWQAFAYGLLGLKTIRKAARTASNMARGDTLDPREVPNDEQGE